ncbi:MAG: WD40/YVTN/BNR-like repeat-containing protein, partial [Planctomycetota bacterium]
GKTFDRVLFANENAGACDLILDPQNPRIIYASTWRVRRTPWALSSGGEGSALWKSTDGGDTWTELTGNKGMPKGTIGIIGVTVSPANPDRVWAIVEARKGGVFRSEDAGKTWARVNSDRSLRQRAWYYTRIYADTKDVDTVYVCNVGFFRSKDGGKTFGRIRVPHSDNHDLWIDPDDPKRMVEANDGGANVSFDAGRTWSRQDNQPTAQFYRVTTDNHFPYRIYGAQQDNSTVRIASRGRRGSISLRDWEPTAGGESGHLAPHPEDPEIVYGGSYGGYLTRVNHRTGERRTVTVWPDNPLGHGAGDLRHRFQWNFPLFFSPHDTNKLYAAGERLFVTTDEGHSWTPLSPDLTRNDKSKLGASGGPITKDNTGVEYYCTIFAALESPHEAGVLWCGTDDGLIHISRDGGKSWANVTPDKSLMPEWTRINSIEAHPFEKGGLYVAATNYQLDDFRPYLFKTTDYGKTWKKITSGIADDHFARVVRADPERRGLLYAGTERGVYVSFDDGDSWRSLQLKLPVVPVTDLAVKAGDLIAATQGRSFWVLDDLAPLRQAAAAPADAVMHVYAPRKTWRMGGGGRRGGRPSRTRGSNPPGGVQICFYLKDTPGKDETSKDEAGKDEAGKDEAEQNDETKQAEAENADVVRLAIRELDGTLVRAFSTKPDKDKKEGKLAAKKGANRFAWNMRYGDAETFPGMVLWGGGTNGPVAPPGEYLAALTVGGETMSVAFQLVKDPRSAATEEDLQEQFTFLIGMRDKITETHLAIREIRDVKEQVAALQKRLKDDTGAKEVLDAGKALVKELTKIEEALYQTKSKSRQDPLNYPIRLNNRLTALVRVVATGDNPPTAQARAVYAELAQAIDAEIAKLRQVISTGLMAFNHKLMARGTPAIHVKALEAAAKKKQ